MCLEHHKTYVANTEVVNIDGHKVCVNILYFSLYTSFLLHWEIPQLTFAAVIKSGLRCDANLLASVALYTTLPDCICEFAAMTTQSYIIVLRCLRDKYSSL